VDLFFKIFFKSGGCLFEELSRCFIFVSVAESMTQINPLLLRSLYTSVGPTTPEIELGTSCILGSD
jgi:hypothetical protein